MRQKSLPIASDLVQSTRGIQFSFLLQPAQRELGSPCRSNPDSAIDDDSTISPPLSPPPSIASLGGYDLELSVHNITSSSLLSRMRPNQHSSPTKEKAGFKKRKITQNTSQPGECTWCFTRKTAQWRKGTLFANLGPSGPRGLCNRCGIEWMKSIKVVAKTASMSNNEAESQLIANYRETERFKRFSREHLEGYAPER